MTNFSKLEDQIIDLVFWYKKYKILPQLKQNIKTDIVIVGGGMAGLTAAQEFANSGLKVALVEKHFCGSGASGKSSGFITPDSEFSLSDFINKFGKDNAIKLWKFALEGCDRIRNNIKSLNLDCDYFEQDTVVFASKEKDLNKILKKEFEARKELGYATDFLTKDDIRKIINSDKYFGAIKYSNTFGIKAYDYCQQLKEKLLELGVLIFEETPAIKVTKDGIVTPKGPISAGNIILCMDKDLPELDKLSSQVYHVQTFIGLSEVLDDKQIAELFPSGPIMAWDTDLIYNYFRLTGDKRLIVGGASLFDTYANKPKYNNSHMKRYFNKFVNSVFNMQIKLEYIWPGLIGVSKDIMPVSGFDREQKNLYYITAATGLPWATALGIYSARKILNNSTEYDAYFDPYRKFPIGSNLQKIIGKKLAFAISNFRTLSSV